MQSLVLFFFVLPFVWLWVDSVPGLVVGGEKQSIVIELSGPGVIECSFMHSVEKSRVVELYRMDKRGLVLYEARTKSSGWGLPSSEPGYSMKRIGGETWFVFDVVRPVTELVIATDPVNDYTLRVGDRTLKLEDFGRQVTIEGKRFYRIGLGPPEWKMYLRVP